MRKTPIILLCAAMLALPAARAESNVTVMPTLAPDVTIAVQTDEYAIDLSGYYGNDAEGTNGGMYQSPSLTDAEKARVPALLARYANGERPAQSALDKTENVSVGVYPLIAEEYQGEPVFVLIPCRELTDEELLELIDGCAQLGLTFDAEGLSWRNCMRGGGIENNRTFAGDEGERAATLKDLYTRQGLRPEQPFTAIPGDDGVGEISLNEDDYCGLDRFSLYPSRRMTDEELLRLIQNSLGENIPDTAAYSKYEGQARAQMKALFGAPLSLKLTYESIGKASDNSVYNDDREVYRCTFGSADDTQDYFVLLDTATGLIYNAYVSLAPYDSLAYCDLRADPFAEKWLVIARDAVSAMRSDNLAIASVEAFGESDLQYGGFCACVTVTMADESCYELRIPFQTERAFSFEYRQVPALLEQAAPVNN